MYDTQDLNNVSWKFTNPIHNEQAKSLLNNNRSDVSRANKQAAILYLKVT